MNILITAIGSFSAECVIDSLKDITTVNKIIGCDIPLTDTEVDFFNLHRNYFNEKNIQITIGSSDFISIARDKKKLNEFVKQNNFDSIKTYSLNNLDTLSFPLIGKPINGRSSEGIIRMDSVNDLNIKLEFSNYIFQEFIEGEICTVDYIRDSKTKDFCAIPRIEHLRTKNGAGMTVEVVNNSKIVQLANEIGSLLDVHGCINYEFILNNNKYYLIDINPRFSAGVGFSKVAGYDFPRNLYKLYNNETIEAMAKYKRMILQKKMVEVINIIFE